MEYKNKKKTSEPREKKDHFQELTDKLIQRLEDDIKYEKPWFICNEAPFNPVTGTKYRGVNFVSLTQNGFDDPRFYTFNNIKSLAEETGQKLHVRKGEHGSPVFKAVQIEIKAHGGDGELVEIGSPLEPKEGEGQDGEKKAKIWVLAYSGTVFNGSQIEGLEPYQYRERPAFQQQEEAEKVIEAMRVKGGVDLRFHSNGQAYYQPGADRVVLPNRELFKNDALFYRTALHEFGHSTGHPSRLNRDQTGQFGSEKYAREELVAELSSYFMGAELGLPYDGKTHENHAAYVKSWLAALKNDKSFIIKASQAAAKSVDYQLARRDEYVRDLEQQKTTHKVLDNMMAKLGVEHKATREQERTVAFSR
ncbi:ArdC family protein [Burkholderia cenocepacia]|uniref:ArdC family protein n=1 Tax=Burkholderia cenocepacia TaxID=95486 RepID=UPI0009821D31|nr:zincin-like metallopeptidase domain-containing protein [Burkholderia cenocepacia]AQQ43291.1 hypothetical protein A8E75_30770 [Burkholderia cenocepacia]ONV25317.1 hypothetical protein A8E74_09850 [Burkholderia cenocepacia]ONV30559.1 hypothetical protein A8E78_17275 [Burkholderia cenocepacia]ONV33480.1 hypothetical protein A8E77_16015 [Burkholderia cenocepacia]ONV40588.1 hypothetical protein A8E82_19725 [Burkholderia cenocepacia]